MLGCLNPFAKREYKILDKDKQQVGSIVNIYNGFVQEVCSRSNMFGITFPDQSTVDNKIMLIKAAIMIDYYDYMS